MISIDKYTLKEELFRTFNAKLVAAERTTDLKPFLLKIGLSNPPQKPETAYLQKELSLLNKINDRSLTFLREAHLEAPIPHLLFEPLPDSYFPLQSLGEKRSISLSEKLSLAIKLCSLFGKLHSLGVFHKEISPQLIFSSPDLQTLRLLDFTALASAIGDRAQNQDLHLDSPALYYIAPEQTGRMNKTVDYRSNIYSVGLLLHELFSGARPCQAQDPLEVIHWHLAKTCPPLTESTRGLPEVLSTIIQKLIAKDPDSRYRSLLGAQADLEKCSRLLSEHPELPAESLPSFELGRTDLASDFRISKKLYDREEALSTLAQSFQNAQNGSLQLVILSGHAGSGKTALVDALYQPIFRSKGFFIRGKYEQLHENIPFYALSQALSELTQALLMESDEHLQIWRDAIQMEIGPNARVISDLDPHFSRWIGLLPELERLSPQQSQLRTLGALEQYLGLFSKREHPLVVFLDDLQWSDVPTLELLKQVLTRRRSSSLCIILAYRENELSASHPLQSWLAEVRELEVPTSEIKVNPLSAQAVKTLVSDTLLVSPERAEELAEVVLERTLGNSFYINEFLKSLSESGLVFFDSDTRSWTWDLNRIKDHSISGGVAELLVRKIGKLPNEAIDLMRIAAHLGHSFELVSLLAVSEAPAHSVITSLAECSKLGLIHSRGGDLEILRFDVSKAEATTIHFVHDKIQLACHSLLSEVERPALHLKIAKSMIRWTAAPFKGADLFSLAQHLNLAKTLIRDSLECLEAARYNLQAAQAAMASSAFHSALNFALASRDYLKAESWSKNLDLNNQVHLCLANAYSLAGKFEESSEVLQALRSHPQSLENKAEISEIRLRTVMAQGRVSEAPQIVWESLNLLGLSLPHPKRVRSWHILYARLKLSLLFNLRSRASIVSAPRMTHPNGLLLSRLILEAGPSLSFSAQSFHSLATLSNVLLTLKYGNAPESGAIYVIFGYDYSKRGNITKARSLRDIGIEVHSRVGSQKAKTYILSGGTIYLLWQWATLSRVKETLRESSRLGFATGQSMHAALMLTYIAIVGFLEGNSLENRIPDCDQAIKCANELAQKSAGSLALPLFQLTTQLLQTFSSDGLQNPQLNGTHFNPLQLEQYKKLGNNMTLFHCHLFTGYYQLLFSNPTAALSSALQAEALRKMLLPVLSVPVHFYVLGLSCIRTLRATPSSHPRSKLLKTLEICLKHLRRWARSAPEYVEQKYLHLQGERDLISPRSRDGLSLLALAHERALKHHNFADAGMIAEALGRDSLRRESNPDANKWIALARDHYETWGATQKVGHLEAEFPLIFSMRTSEKPSDLRLPAKSDDRLELATLLKASQVISKEIQLPALLKKLLSLLAENAGANKVVLILKEESASGERWMVRASLSPDGISDFSKRSYESDSSLPLSIIRLTLRTQRQTLLRHAFLEGEHVHDPYIAATRSKSILCFPLLKQGETVGIIFLENTLTENTFTPAQVKTLDLLSSQMAISIENATLYANMEGIIENRTRALNRSKEHLSDLYAKLDATTQSIRSIFQNINQGICTLGPDLKIAGDYSEFLSSLLGEKDLRDSNFIEILFRNTDTGPDRIHLIEEVLEASIGEPRINFDSNEKSLPRSTIKQGPDGAKRILEIDWTPIVDHNESVQTVMCTLRDVTELQSLRELAASAEREAKAIQKIMAVDPEVLNRFFSSATGLLKSFTPSSLHTLKGNSRTIGLSELTDLVHKAEDQLSAKPGLGKEIQTEIQSRLNFYQEVFEKVGFQKRAHSQAVSRPFSQAILDVARSLLEESHKHRDAQISSLCSAVLKQAYQSIDDILRPIISHAPTLAKELGRNTPKFIIASETTYFDSISSEKLASAFGHLVRNSLDHGFSGSHLNPEIHFSCEPRTGSDLFELNYFDNGSGLNLAAIQSIGLQKGWINETSPPAEVAQLIFKAGLSTRSTVSLTSGRGVGMEAFLDCIKDLDGTTEIQLGNQLETGYYSFRLSFSIPKKYGVVIL